MMRSSFDEDDAFAVNPFRSDPYGQQPQQQQPPPVHQMQQQPPPQQMQAQQQPMQMQQPSDPFYSAQQSHAPPQWSQQQAQAAQWTQQPQPPPQGAAQQQWTQPAPQVQYPQQQLPPMPPPLPQMPVQQQQPYLSGAMDQRMNSNPNNEIASTPVSWWFRCFSCFRLEGYQPYFDLDTAEFAQRLQASVTVWWQHDVFRTTFLREDKPDLYGPLWIGMTLIFTLAAASNLSDWFQFHPTSADDDSEDVQYFEYDIRHLLRASTVVSTFGWGLPSLLWLVCTCLGMPQISWAMWMCVYGYSLTIFVPVCFLAAFPWALLRWIILGGATGMSALLVLRNLSSPLLAQDAANHAKASPVIMSMIGAHVVWFLVLKFGFL